MNKQRLIIIGIFVTTFILVIGAILISMRLIGNNSNNSSATKTTNIPSLTAASLVCTSTTDGKSLTVTWTVPTGTSSSYTVAGKINNTSVNVSSPVIIPPQQNTTSFYTWTSANQTDNYQAIVWIQDASGNQGTSFPTNSINSSQCTSGTQPTLTVTATASTTQTTTATPTPTVDTSTSKGSGSTTTPTPTVTTTLTPTPTSTTDGGSTSDNSNLPDTADNMPLIITLLLGVMLILTGGILFFVKDNN